MTRERTEKGETTVEVVYGITSLGRERADAKRLLELTRGHWGIENGLHYVRDVTMGEDASRVRKGSGAAGDGGAAQPGDLRGGPGGGPEGDPAAGHGEDGGKPCRGPPGSRPPSP